MFSLKYQISNPESWHQEMAKQIPIETSGNSFLLQNSFGSGGGQFVALQPGLWIEQLDLTLKEQLSVEILPKQHNDYFSVTFWLTNAQVKQQLQERELQFKYDNVSIVLVSSTIHTAYNLPINEEIKTFMIWMSKEWMLENVVSTKNAGLRQVFERDAPIYYTESLDYKFKYLLDKTDFTHSEKLPLLINTLQLLNCFFRNLEQHSCANLASLHLHNSDLKKLMIVREYINANPLKEISLEFMSTMAGMSLSKFKRLFKEVFRTTPYKYCLKIKLEIAMELLQTNKYSVSEVGFLIGYSNLSQFSKAFKNYHGLLPSDVKS